MATDPSEDAIESFQSITQFDRALAIKWLQTYHNDLNLAINNCLESNGQLPEAPGYDESAFSQDRYGGFSYAVDVPSFQIEHGHNAPTRPQSKASNHKSEDSGVDITPAGAPGTPSGQETGLIGNSRNFRPATKQYYDASQWAMTIPGASAVEIVPDLDPPDRKREVGKPCLLKPSPTDCDYLPSLLTILASIPLARNALIFPKVLGEDYGSHPDWWKGSPVSASEARELESGRDTPKHLELIQETQRLMAFLERSDRAYGTVDNLKGILDAIDLNEREIEEIALSLNKSVAESFLVKWTSSCLRVNSVHEAQDCLYHSRIGTRDNSLCAFLVEPLRHGFEYGSLSTLYDVLDRHLFNSFGSQDEPPMTIIENAKILTLRLLQPVEIPVTLYADRYIADNQNEIMIMLHEMDEHRKLIELIEQERKRLLTFETPALSASNMDMSELLNATKIALQASSGLEETDEDLTEIADLLKPDTGAQTRLTGLLQDLEDLSELVKQKSEDLNLRLDQARVELRNISKQFTQPDPSTGYSPKLRYTLRGVSVEPTTTFVLKPSEEISQASLDNSTVSFEWWQMEYTYADTITPQLITKVVTEEVVLAAANASRTHGLPGTLLVYAIDEAVQCSFDPLPQPLKDFVERDNQHFRAEFETQQEHSWNYQDHSWPKQLPVEGPVYSIDSDANPPPYDPSGYHPQNGDIDDRKDSEHDINMDSQTSSLPETEMVEKNGPGLFSPLNNGPDSKPHSDIVMVDPEELVSENSGNEVVHIEHVSSGNK